jgi:hypothetical protein
MLIKAATGGLLSFIPLRLVINPKKTIIPATGQPTTIYVVTVEFQGGIEQLQQKALEMGKERVSLIENMRDIEIEARKIVSSDVNTDQEEKEFAEEFFPENIETKPEAEKEAPQKNEKVKPSKTDTEEAGSKVTETIKTPKKNEKDDSLLGAKTKEKKPVKPEESTVSEKLSKEQISEATGIPIKIRRDQLIKILDLKVNKRQINDQKFWHKLIKNMKFPDVTKANDMTVEQGDKFIKFLEELDDIPF